VNAQVQSQFQKIGGVVLLHGTRYPAPLETASQVVVADLTPQMNHLQLDPIFTRRNFK
jgi:hypothetical protein